MRQNHRDIGEKEILDTLLNDSYSNDLTLFFPNIIYLLKQQMKLELEEKI